MNSCRIRTILIIFILFIQLIHADDPSEHHIFNADNPSIQYIGRIDFSDPQKPKISSAGAYFQFRFKGSSCVVMLRNQNLYGNHNYIAYTIDNAYQGRLRIDSTQTRYQLATNLSDSIHSLLVCKATESQNGYIEFYGVACEKLLPPVNTKHRKIEFIGNSITCGMGLELTEIRCDSGTWYDQHNAFSAFGPIIARELNADWLLSAVSGIGVVRNWNSPGPTLPQVYSNLYLNTDSTLVWNSERYQPDLISICLGTNDFSDGDGSYQRDQLDSATFVDTYIHFLNELRRRYPSVQICCLTSPTVTGDKGIHMLNYISAIVNHFRHGVHDMGVHMYTFKQTYAKGCSGHPDKAEHQMIAAELLPFFKQIMQW